MTPIAVFAYNRPEHVTRALESLARCVRIDECRVYIFCDGPKAEKEANSVWATRSAVHELAPKLNAEIIERENNFGLARSIVTGVTELCERYGRVIVLEDDLLVSPDFIDFMLQSLDRYSDSDNVFQVAGFMYPVDHPASTDAFFLPMTCTWGWATWHRAWTNFDATPDVAILERLAGSEIRARFDPYGDDRFIRMLRKRIRGENNSWGILWYSHVFQRHGLILWPRQSLVWVGGFDSSGTHCGDGAPFAQEPAESFRLTRLETPARFPGLIAVDDAAFGRIKELFWNSRSTRSIARVSQKILSILHRILYRD